MGSILAAGAKSAAADQAATLSVFGCAASGSSDDHWGNQINLFVTDTKFDFDDAQGPRDGAAAKKFSIYEIPPQHLGKPAEIVFHFVPGKTNISMTTHNN